MKKYLKEIFLDNAKYWLIIILSFALFIVCSLFLKEDMLSNNYIKRLGVDEYDTKMQIEVEGLLDEPKKIEIPVSKRVYSESEAKEAIKKGLDEILAVLPGDNSSLQNITVGLNPINEIGDLGIGVVWDFGDTDIVDVMGNVHNEDLKESVDIDVVATLSYEAYEESYIIPVRICPKMLSEDERLLKGLKDSIVEADKSQVEKDGYTLPDVYEGKKLAYRYGEATDFNLIWIMGIIIALLLYIREKNNKRKTGEKRKRELMKDYPEIVSKLIVFIGAGLSVRQSWEGIVRDYEADDSKEKRYAYEEMAKALERLKNGTQENIVYKDFGRSCSLRQYMKLASLLEQNRRSGLSNLQTLLSLESQSAWDERINLARREGEELSIKLLFPLFMMLLIVMMMIIVPALLIFY